MRILYFMEDYFCGGVDTFMINLINSWPQASDELVLVCNQKHSGLGLLRKSIFRPLKLVEHNIPIFTSFFEHPKGRDIFDCVFDIVLKILSPLLRYIFLFYNVFAFRRVLLRENADRLLVVNNGYPAGDSCRAAAISWGLFSKKPPSLHNFHGIALRPGWHIRLQEQMVDSLVSRYSGLFISVSRAAAESMSCRRRIYKNNRVTYIYNGIGLNDSNLQSGLSDIRREFGIPSAGKLCLALGAYHSNRNFDKGYDFLLRAFKRVVQSVPAAHLLICGYGSAENMGRVRQLVLGLGIEKNIHLSGFRSDVSPLLRQADIVLIASQAFESFCLATIEAMSHRLPVVATNAGAIPEIVLNGQGGYCVDKSDAGAYAAHTVRLLSDDNLRREQGEKGFQRYSESFTACRMAREYARLIHNG